MTEDGRFLYQPGGFETPFQKLMKLVLDEPKKPTKNALTPAAKTPQQQSNPTGTTGFSSYYPSPFMMFMKDFIADKQQAPQQQQGNPFIRYNQQADQIPEMMNAPAKEFNYFAEQFPNKSVDELIRLWGQGKQDLMEMQRLKHLNVPTHATQPR